MQALDVAWTDERVNRLKQLWTEGLSCSQIAADLGSITRSAVIGKVHRLRLPGRDRAKSTITKATVTRHPRTPPSSTSTDPLAPALATVPHRLRPFARAKAEKTPHLADRTGAPIAQRPRVTRQNHVLEVFDRTEAVELPPDESPCAVTFDQLEPHHCRWPIGDPSDLATFRFCGADRLATADNLPYCARHARIAYQPLGKRGAGTYIPNRRTHGVGERTLRP